MVAVIRHRLERLAFACLLRSNAFPFLDSGRQLVLDGFLAEVGAVMVENLLFCADQTFSLVLHEEEQIVDLVAFLKPNDV